ncbi:uncharacterized protein DC041_0003051 [Schistosoma bovis]|uniref:Uncharacterized protein n=1 Tax=Schistosoma bovis TaxID=6184 RepID=A0A430QGS3_SCHBO|nr:uncharacterized protein DC041_0003051 [Schistosoma bovis]
MQRFSPLSVNKSKFILVYFEWKRNQEDFLNRIACGEEHVFNEAYDTEFSPAFNSNNTNQSVFDISNATKARQLGIVHGAKLASEFGFCYGMVLEIITSRQQLPYFNDIPNDHSNNNNNNNNLNLTNNTNSNTQLQLDKMKKNHQIYKIAQHLYQYLIESPGLIQLSNYPQLNKSIHYIIDDDDNNNNEILKYLRNKMKQLKSLLDIHSIEEKMNNYLTF